MSAAVVWRPRLKRRLARASSAGRPMAVSTCEGSTAPDEQAAPVEQARPFRSSAMTKASPSMPGKVMFVVLGVRRRSSSVDAGIRHALNKGVLQRVAQCRDALGVFSERCLRDLRSFSQTDDAGDIFGARPEPPLVMSAVEQLPQSRAAADVQSAYPLWRVKLVAREGEQVEVQRVDVDRNFPRRLHGVGMEVHVGFAGDAPDFLERLNRAQLVVSVHHGDECRLGMLAQ